MTKTDLNCEYVKIKEEEVANQTLNNSNFENINNTQGFSFVSVAHAQSNSSLNVSDLAEQLTFPFYLTFFSFLFFVIVMTIVYYYHLTKFSLGDPFMKNFVPIFIGGLMVLALPLLFSLY